MFFAYNPTMQVLCGDARDSSGELITVGSVAGGGRYDGLVGMFDPKNRQVRLTSNLLLLSSGPSTTSWSSYLKACFTLFYIIKTCKTLLQECAVRWGEYWHWAPILHHGGQPYQGQRKGAHLRDAGMHTFMKWTKFRFFSTCYFRKVQKMPVCFELSQNTLRKFQKTLPFHYQLTESLHMETRHFKLIVCSNLLA